MVSYKQRCALCKQHCVLISSLKTRFPICSVCEMKEVEKPVEDPAFVKMFDVPREWYEKNSFLRSVRYQYGRFGELTEKQIAAFKRTVKEMREQGAKDAQPLVKKKGTPAKKKRV